ncbi:MAG TPA: chorismate-binding protein, partial [Pyrinomonadaceae bacterium]|nr:chorismate-binding protein [Pyrinomonadaceae bacterium]
MKEIKISANELVTSLLAIAADENVCILDSAGTTHLGSHLLIAGVRPVEVHEVTDDDPSVILDLLDRTLGKRGRAAMLTLSYDFGKKLHFGPVGVQGKNSITEPDIFLAVFDTLIVHDYNSGATFLTGDPKTFENIEKLILAKSHEETAPIFPSPQISSDFSREEYLAAVEEIREQIRRGHTYQTNLTQQFRLQLSPRQTPADIFKNLRSEHPAPFGAFLRRRDSTVVSASPERFFKITELSNERIITASPVKGTRPRGMIPEADRLLRLELFESEKDRAENVMIVDLMRNDLGRVCEFGSVIIEKLCEIEEHPTLLHLVSTIEGRLRKDVRSSEIVRALFPCGSITGAPKL